MRGRKRHYGICLGRDSSINLWIKINVFFCFVLVTAHHWSTNSFIYSTLAEQLPWQPPFNRTWHMNGLDGHTAHLQLIKHLCSCNFKVMLAFQKKKNEQQFPEKWWNITKTFVFRLSRDTEHLMSLIIMMKHSHMGLWDWKIELEIIILTCPLSVLKDSQHLLADFLIAISAKRKKFTENIHPNE